jgi:phenylacetate-CoA ligase
MPLDAAAAAGRDSTYGRCLRQVLLPLADRARGVPIGSVLETLEQTQWWPERELVALQGRKLRALVRAAAGTFPTYARLLADHGIRPEAIRGVEDLQTLPLVTKELVRAAHADDAGKRRGWVTVRTGGSTGEPLYFRQSRQCRTWDRASYYRFLRWCGSDRGEVLFAVWGDPVVMQVSSRLMRRLQLRFVTRQKALDAFRMTPDRMDEFIDDMWRDRPLMVRGYASALVELGEYLRSTGRRPPPLTAVATTAEQLLPLQRRLIEHAFAAPVFDQYGSAEVGGAAYECDRHAGLHVASEHCIVEVIDGQGRAVPAGQAGELAVTNLDNEAAPFIRYVNGDRGAIAAGGCDCGRALPLLTAIEGRTCDLIRGVNGNAAHGEFFTHALHELGWTERLELRAFQVAQVDDRALDVRIVAAHGPGPDDVRQLTRRIQDYLGPMRVELRLVDRLERSGSGKFRFIVREDARSAQP